MNEALREGGGKDSTYAFKLHPEIGNIYFYYVYNGDCNAADVYGLTCSIDQATPVSDLEVESEIRKQLLDMAEIYDGLSEIIIDVPHNIELHSLRDWWNTAEWQFKSLLDIQKSEQAQESTARSVLLPKGSPLGLCDTGGVEFKVGSVVRCNTEVNEEMHGSWVEYEITLQGTVPLMVYLRSEKGEMLSRGCTAGCLSDVYDMSMFVFAKDSMSLRPDEDIFIQE